MLYVAVCIAYVHINSDMMIINETRRSFYKHKQDN